MSINYDFGDLEAFLVVKETGSFHAAAERLNLSQSAITRRIRKLEQALDSLLFERTTRAVKPTLAAKRLQARAEAILQDARETARAMRDDSVAFAHQRNAVVTVATIPTVVSDLLSRAIAELRRDMVSVRIRLLDQSANDVAEAVAQGEADIGLCSIPMLEPGTEFEPLFDDPIILAQPRGWPGPEGGDLAWSRIGDMPLILPARGTGNRLIIDEALAAARLPLVWTYEVIRSATALDLVTAGLGAALLPQSAIGQADVDVFRLSSPNVTRAIGLLSRAGQPETAPVALLKSRLRQSVLG